MRVRLCISEFEDRLLLSRLLAEAVVQEATKACFGLLGAARWEAEVLHVDPEAAEAVVAVDRRCVLASCERAAASCVTWCVGVCITPIGCEVCVCTVVLAAATCRCVAR